MNCKKCGFILNSENKTCPSCGEVNEFYNGEVDNEQVVQTETAPVGEQSVIETPIETGPIVNEQPIVEPVTPISQPVNPVINNLQGNGVDTNTIPTMNSQVSNSNIEKKKGSKLWLIIVIIIVILAGLGFVTYKFILPKVNKTEPVAEKEEKEESMVIGTDNYGYLKLPGTWYKFNDVEGKTALQYTKDRVWIVSLESYLPSSPDQTAENLAKASLYNMINNEENVENATGATVKLAGYDAYQTYCYYTVDGIWLVEWFFEPGDGRIHYISVEGNDYTSDYFKIPETFSLKKIN